MILFLAQWLGSALMFGCIVAVVISAAYIEQDPNE